ncbi:YidB family protein [Enterobacter asburiae]|uniref:YidB family protein n=1 Tax=unclassified Scandinavium TaxID=2830652 RepID=UPI00289D9B63|nr:YidB family protein [Scandinavium sp.]
MSLFDQVAGMFGGQDGKAGAYQAILSWIEEQGGIQALLERFQQGGLGAIVESWISTGGNQPVSADQITQALGSPAVADLAAKLGIEPQAASNLIAEHLPKMVDTLSPNGAVDGQQDLMTEGLNLLKGKFFS